MELLLGLFDAALLRQNDAEVRVGGGRADNLGKSLETLIQSPEFRQRQS